MFITPAYAQAAGGGFESLLINLFPLVAIIAIFYFLFIRPQQRRVKLHQEMVRNLRRGDTVVTAGGIVGKIAKVVDDTEIQVEVAEGVRIRVVRSLVSEVRAKGEPVKDDV